jgi:hypothetical protein
MTLSERTSRTGGFTAATEAVVQAAPAAQNNASPTMRLLMDIPILAK